MKPLCLEIVKIDPVEIDCFTVSTLEIDLVHVNYGLDPLTKPTSIDEHYIYFAQDLYAFWSKNWFRLVFCIEIQEPSTAGIITIYQLK